jgi:hypothetical protein
MSGWMSAWPKAETPMPDPIKVRWRVGTKVGRTIYAMLDGSTGGKDCDDAEKLNDVLIGLMDTPELAVEVVVAHNARTSSRRRHPSSHE